MTTSPKIAATLANILPWILSAALAVVLALGDGRYARAGDHVKLMTKVEVMDRGMGLMDARLSSCEAKIEANVNDYIPRRELEAILSSIRDSLAAQDAWNERYDKKLDLIAERLVHGY